jgi:hypothetical protein
MSSTALDVPFGVALMALQAAEVIQSVTIGVRRPA